MNQNAMRMRLFLKRIDKLLQSIPAVNTQQLIVDEHDGSNDLIERLALLHQENEFLDYEIGTKDGIIKINRLMANMMSKYIETYHVTTIGQERENSRVDMPDITSEELNLLISIVFRQPRRVTTSILCRLVSIAAKYLFLNPVQEALRETMNECGPNRDDMVIDGALEVTDNYQVDIRIHNGSDKMIEILGSLHSNQLFHNYTIELEEEVRFGTAEKMTLNMNKLIACMMSRVIRQKCITDVGKANSNIFDMRDVSVSELELLTEIVFRKHKSISEPILDRLIFIADEYEFQDCVCTKLWKTMYSREVTTGDLYIASFPNEFDPQAAIGLTILGTLVNVRQIVPLLLNGIPVMIKNNNIELSDLRWDASVMTIGRSYSVEYVEVAQRLAGLNPNAFSGGGYAPRGEATMTISRETVAHVAYDLIEYGMHLALNSMSDELTGDFNPTPEYWVDVRGDKMNARRLVPFIINSMYASFVIKEKSTGDKPSQLKPKNIKYRDNDRQWKLNEDWIQKITDTDTKLYFEIARLAFGMESRRILPETLNLYKQTLNGEKTDFYSPLQDLVSFGKWLAHNESRQFDLG